MADLSAVQSCAGRHRAEPGRGSGRYVGRVGALAVALGVGLAVSGGPGLAVAFADDDASATGSPPSERADPDAGEAAGAEPPSPTDSTDEADDESDADDDLAADETDAHDVEDDEAEQPAEATATEPSRSRATGSRSTVSRSPALQEIPASEPDPAAAMVRVDGPSFDAEADSVPGQSATILAPVASEVTSAGLAEPIGITPAPTGGAPSAPAGALTAAVGLLLSPFVAPGPAGPSEPPISWAALAFARREIARDVDADSEPVAPAESTSAAALVAGATLRSAAAPVLPTAVPVPHLLEVIGSVVNGIISGIGNIISSVISGLIAGLQNLIAVVFNTPPVARVDTYSTAAGAALTTTAATGVLTNDTDVNGNILTAHLVSGPFHGVLELNPDGSFTYTPAAGFTGADAFSYRASDGLATSAATTVNLNVVVAVNNPPTVNDDSYDAVEATALTVSAGSGVLANDADDQTLTAHVVVGPSHGVLELNPDGSFTYTPAANFSGADFFTYRASDGVATSDTATVRIDVALVDGVPPVTEASEPDQANGKVTGKVTVESRTGNPVTYALAAPVDPALGVVVVNSTTGEWNFTPNPQARLDAAGSPVGARMAAAAAVGDDAVTFVIEATDGANIVAVPVQVSIDPAEAVTTATIELGANPLHAVAHGDRLYVATADRKVLVIDTATNTVIGEIQAGANPTTLAVVGDRLYVIDSPSSGGAGAVWVIDTTTDTVVDLDPTTPGVDTILVGQNPGTTAVDGTLLYVANINDHTASLIDTTTHTVADTIPVGFVPFGLAIGGDRLFAVNLVHGTVTVVDTSDYALVDTDPSTPTVTDPITLPVQPFQNQLSALALSGDRLYVAHLNGNTVFVVDTTTYAVVDQIAVGGAPAGMVAVGDRVYVANAGDGTVSVIDTATNTVVETVEVGANANSFAIGDGHIYVVNSTDSSISVITSRAQPSV